MKSIQDLAREAGGHPDNWNDDYFDMSLLALQRFHDAAIAQHNESLLAGVSEPYCKAAVLDELFAAKAGIDPEAPLYTADQMAAAVLREREGCAQIAWNYEPDENGLIEAAIRGQR